MIYDLPENKVVVNEKGEGRLTPRFSRDGKTVVFTDRSNFNNHQPIWYQLVDGKWTRQTSKQLRIEMDGLLQDCCDDYLVTRTDETDDRLWVDHLPMFCQDFIARVFPPTSQIKLRSWDLVTGEERKELAIKVPFLPYDKKSSLRYIMQRSDIKVSDDAQYVAVNRHSQIDVWQTAPGHSRITWAIIIGLILLASRVAWPRRIPHPPTS